MILRAPILVLVLLFIGFAGSGPAQAAPSCPSCKPSPGVVLRWDEAERTEAGTVVTLTLEASAAVAGSRLRLAFDVPAGLEIVGHLPEFDEVLAAGESRRFTMAVRTPATGRAILGARGEVVSSAGAAYRVGASVRLGPEAVLPPPVEPARVVVADAHYLQYAGRPLLAGDRTTARPPLGPREDAASGRSPEQGETVIGSFHYRDRTFDGAGFLVDDPADDRVLPIRRAEVQVLRNGTVVGTGMTGDDGAFRVGVATTGGSYQARITSRAPAGSLPDIRVYDAFASKNLYASLSQIRSAPGGGADVDLGVTVVEAGEGGEAFNILDVCLEAADVVASLQGAAPANGLSVYWTNQSRTGTYYSAGSRGIFLLDEEGYDDCVVVHEYGHFVADQFSDDDSPGGAHFIDENGQNPLLSWSEGWASFWQSAVRRHRPDDPAPSWYVDNNLDGSLLFSYESEGPSPIVAGLGSEVVVQSLLWDLIDNAGTPDPQPGVDDDPLALPLAEIWEVFAGPVRTATLVTLEDFRSGWTLVGNGFESEIRALFAAAGVELFPDGRESDDVSDLAAALPLDGTPVRRTFHPAPDVDYHRFDLAAGDVVTVETLDVGGYGDTFLEIYDAALNRIAFNDNAPAFDALSRWTGFASSVSFEAPRTGTYFARVSRAANGYAAYVVYGAYSVRAVRGRPGNEAFVSVGPAAGVATTAFSVGAAFADYNADGLLDLLVVNNPAGGTSGEREILYRNLGNGAFANAAASAGLPAREGGIGAAWGDFDNDGDPDLFLTDHALFRNDGGVFADVTVASGIVDRGREFDGAWADYDGDGRLDLFVAVRNAPSALWRNNGNGTFTDVAAAAGLVFPADGGQAYGASWGDYDGDRRPDLFVTFLSAIGHRLYRNLGNGRFADVTAAAGTASDDPAIGSVWGDVDGDGRLDLFVSSTGPNRLYLNRGDGTFVDRAAAWGVGESGISRGAGFADFDLDGDLDLFLVNFEFRNVLYENVGGAMARTAQAVGQGLGHACAWGDYDNDGDPDVYAARQSDANFLFQNAVQSTDPRPFLKVALRGVFTNRDGIGAVIRAYSDGRVEAREVGTGTGWAAKSRTAELFGFADGAPIDSVRVDWPSGAWNVVVAPVPSTTITVVEDTSTPVLPPGPPPPFAVALGPAFPNPFTGATTLRFSLTGDADVRLSLYDVRGRRVRLLLERRLPAGDHVEGWDGLDDLGRAAAPGVYFYRLDAGPQTHVRKLVRIGS